MVPIPTPALLAPFGEESLPVLTYRGRVPAVATILICNEFRVRRGKERFIHGGGLSKPLHRWGGQHRTDKVLPPSPGSGSQLSDASVRIGFLTHSGKLSDDSECEGDHPLAPLFLPLYPRRHEPVKSGNSGAARGADPHHCPKGQKGKPCRKSRCSRPEPLDS